MHEMDWEQKCKRDPNFNSFCAINKSYELELMIMLGLGFFMCKVELTGPYAHF